MATTWNERKCVLRSRIGVNSQGGYEHRSRPIKVGKSGTVNILESLAKAFERHLAEQHVVQDNAARPDVGGLACIILLVTHELWRGVHAGPTHGGHDVFVLHLAEARRAKCL